jgi:hypothetical protein
MEMIRRFNRQCALPKERKKYAPRVFKGLLIDTIQFVIEKRLADSASRGVAMELFID